MKFVRRSMGDKLSQALLIDNGHRVLSRVLDVRIGGVQEHIMDLPDGTLLLLSR